MSAFRFFMADWKLFGIIIDMKTNNIFKLIIAIIVCELAGFLGSIFTTPSIPGWYAQLDKPELAPPNYVFAPVWIALFALMGVAAFLIWKKGLDRKDVKIALFVFGGQLALNVLWSIIFFGLHSLVGAFVEIIFLWLAILATIILFFKISKVSAWLLIPYILWVSFAGFLNFSILQLSVDVSRPVYCTQEAKLCPDGSYVGRTWPNCEFAPCPGNIILPNGYGLEDYKIEKILDVACVSNGDCETPGEYLVQSRCPFVSLCLKNKCAVVCPGQTE